MKRYFKSLSDLFRAVTREPKALARILNTLPHCCDGCQCSRRYAEKAGRTDDGTPSFVNPIWEYFQNHREGPGIWKWEHYLDIYNRHFARFVGRKVNVLEIGIYSCESLKMWHAYFGGMSHIYGVDIEEACRAYEDDHVSIFIGDQADRRFGDRSRTA